MLRSFSLALFVTKLQKENDFLTAIMSGFVINRHDILSVFKNGTEIESKEM
jgi:hypothetical protein